MVFTSQQMLYIEHLFMKKRKGENVYEWKEIELNLNNVAIR